MDTTKTILLIMLGVVAVVFISLWCVALVRRRQLKWPGWYYQIVGFVTNFFDALGIGSFATTTAIFRLRRSIPDDLLPGTLNVGHSLPTIVQAIVAFKIIEVESRTLALMIGASVLGAVCSAEFVVRLSKRTIQFWLGFALLAAAALMSASLMKIGPAGGDAFGLTGVRLWIGVAGCFVFGALMMIGVGAYAPIMIMVSLLGMNSKSAFPIMMGACAFLMPIGGLRFVRQEKYDAKSSIGLTLGGLPAVVLAVCVVQSLSLKWVQGLVVLVAVYSAVGLIRASTRKMVPTVASASVETVGEFAPVVALEEGKG